MLLTCTCGRTEAGEAADSASTESPERSWESCGCDEQRDGGNARQLWLVKHKTLGGGVGGGGGDERRPAAHLRGGDATDADAGSGKVADFPSREAKQHRLLRGSASAIKRKEEPSLDGLASDPDSKLLGRSLWNEAQPKSASSVQDHPKILLKKSLSQKKKPLKKIQIQSFCQIFNVNY